MKINIKKTISLCIAVMMLLTFCACGSSAKQDENTRTVIDGGGREVTIPDRAERIAVMSGPSYEMVFMLGGKDRIAMTKTWQANLPLALITNPDLANYPNIGANPSSSVNIEDYLKNNVDLVLYYNNDTELKKFDGAGIPSVIAAYSNDEITTAEEYLQLTVEEYLEDRARSVGMIAEVLGDEEALAEFDAWCKYNTDVANKIYERTKDLTDEERPTVYWGNTWGENILATAGALSHAYDVWLIGGKLYAPETTGGNFPEITAEQLFDWDPDIIMVDNHGNYPDLVIKSMLKENSQWASLKAVKNKQLYRVPTSVFFLDKGTTGSLMILWMATLVHPELFSDINMVEEIQYYYKEFYEFDLSKEDAQKILDGWDE